jgi:hypothetical protein
MIRSVTRSTTGNTTSRVVGGGSGGAANPAYQILVKTDNAGTSTSTQFTFPATGTYTIDWGDGTVEELTGAQTHTYSEAGEYVIRVTGGLTAVTFNNGGDKLKLLEIQNWGNIEWSTMAFAYWGCVNVNCTATDVAQTSAVTLFSRVFQSCAGLTIFPRMDFSGSPTLATAFFGCGFSEVPASVDLSAVTSFSFAFASNTALTTFRPTQFTAATSLSAIFDGCTNLSTVEPIVAPIATNLSRVFRNTALRNYTIGDFSAITNGSQMFEGCFLTVATYDAILVYFNANSSQASVTLKADQAAYSAAGQTARAALIADHSWAIEDAGPTIFTSETTVTLYAIAGQSNAAGRADCVDAGTTFDALDALTQAAFMWSRSLQAFVQFDFGKNNHPVGGNVGQFGAEAEILRLTASSSTPVAVVKSTQGGTNMATFWDPDYGTPNRYNDFVEDYLDAVASLTNAGYTVVHGGVLFSQGESDASAGVTPPTYQGDQERFIEQFRIDVSQPTLKFGLTLIHPTTGYPGTTEINTAKTTVAAADANVFTIDSSSYGLEADNIHYDSSGQIDHGADFIAGL